MHLLKAFMLEHLGHLDAPEFAHPAQVVAFQVRDHDQFRNLLLRGLQLIG